MYTQIIRAQGTEVMIHVPNELADKELEIVVNEATQKIINREAILDEAEAFFDSISIKTKGFKFNRDEANER